MTWLRGVRHQIIVLLAAALCLSLTACVAKQTYQTCYDAGVKYLASGNYNEAAIAFQKAIKIDPKQTDAYLQLADVYQAQSDYDNASQTYADMLKANPDEAAVYLDVMDSWQADGDSEPALDSLKKVAELSGNADVQNGLEKALAAQHGFGSDFQFGLDLSDLMQAIRSSALSLPNATDLYQPNGYVNQTDESLSASEGNWSTPTWWMIEYAKEAFVPIDNGKDTVFATIWQRSSQQLKITSYTSSNQPDYLSFSDDDQNIEMVFLQHLDGADDLILDFFDWQEKSYVQYGFADNGSGDYQLSHITYGTADNTPYENSGGFSMLSVWTDTPVSAGDVYDAAGSYQSEAAEAAIGFADKNIDSICDQMQSLTNHYSIDLTAYLNVAEVKKLVAGSVSH